MRRRDFLGLGALSAIQLLALTRSSWSSPAFASGGEGWPGLKRGEDGILELAEGFSYRVLQRAGEGMSDGRKMTPQPDGMAAFEGDNGQIILLRNHELGDEAYMNQYGFEMERNGDGTLPQPRFSNGRFGGVDRLVLDGAALLAELQSGSAQRSAALLDSREILAGTDKNCSGGVMLGGWVTCEESSDPGHGYALFTKPTDTDRTPPRPIRSWGRMHREGVAHDPETGTVYMSEDRPDGCFYRHVPRRPDQPMARGTLQAMVVEGHGTMDPYPDTTVSFGVPGNWAPGTAFKVSWRDIPDPQASEQTCRAQGAALGCTAFNRNEGIVWDQDSVWFISSLGGPVKGGQIFQYIPDRNDPGTGTLVCHLEVTDRRILSCPDNLVMAPWGDVLMAEDNYHLAEGVRNQHIRGLTPNGKIYDLARNPDSGDPGSGRPGAEFTGLCFSPDGQILFVNLQSPVNATIAIHGPWPKAPLSVQE